MNYRDIENLLETYTFEELLDYNGLTEADVLIYLLKQKEIELPEPTPLDFE